MKWFVRFITETSYGVLACWAATGVFSLTLGGLFGASRDFAWLANGALVVHALMSLCVVAVFFVTLKHRRWKWAVLQLACGLMGCVLYIAAFSFVAVCVMFSEDNFKRFEEGEIAWRASPSSDAIPFSVEYRPAHPFLAEYDRRIAFRSGKRVGIECDTGGAGAFAVYAIGTNEFYLIDRLKYPDEDHHNEYRVNVKNETVEARCCEYAWVRVPDESLEVVSRRVESLSVKVPAGEIDSEESVPVGDSLKQKRFIGRIFPSAKVELGGDEPIITNRVVEYKWRSTQISDRVPFTCEWGVSDGHGELVRIGFRSGKKIGIFPGWESGTKSIYKMADGRFLFVTKEGSKWWQHVYRIDPTNEVLCYTWDGRWVEIPPDAREINETFTQKAKGSEPARTGVAVRTDNGSRKVYGTEPRRRTFVGLEYVARITMDGQIVSSSDEEFVRSFDQTKIMGASWNGTAEHDRFFSLFSRIFNGNCEALRKYMENSPDWEIANEDADHLCAFRTFHAGDESCAVRLNLTGKNPGSRIAAKGRCRNPNAGYYAASRALIEELKHLDPGKGDTAKERAHD